MQPGEIFPRTMIIETHWANPIDILTYEKPFTSSLRLRFSTDLLSSSIGEESKAADRNPHRPQQTEDLIAASFSGSRSDLCSRILLQLQLVGIVHLSKMGSEAKVLSLEEVSKHHTKDDCWLIISGKVYDITPFLDYHPGGDEVLVLATKKDATEDFEDVGHSQNAKDMLKDYYVGDIDVNTMPQKGRQYKPPSGSGSVSTQASGGSSNTILMLVLPVVILALAYALYYYAKKD
ncbi:hypothetical protein L2E82_49205 [Cichorium intybus]|uniref:Uncharacterized protein n=1 Tax=Cichorium intybus TaxID=13427 RepID=A0ACB8YZM8_CICIN|nr:hypothetical protein L2E82_49205 [Cichorium intybus]